MFLLSILSSKKLFIVLLIVILFPLIILSLFNNPGSDDFDFSYKTKLMSFCDVQIWRYNNEGGRYFANGIISLNPLVFNNYFLFRIIPIFILFLFVYSLNFFFENLLKPISKSSKWSIVGLIVFLFFYQLPDVCSGFYWITGAITYQLPMSLSLFLVAFLLKYYKDNSKISLFIAILLLIAILGCNEIVVVFNLFILMFIFLYRIIKFKSIDYPFLIILFISIIFSGFELLAPGNSVRGNSIIAEKHLFFNSAFRTLLFSVEYFFKWLPIILISSLFSVDFLYEIIEKTDRKIILNPLLSFLIMCSIIYLGIFPGLWSSNCLLGERVTNTIYFFYIFWAIYFVFTLLYYLKERYNYTINLSFDIKTILGIIILIFTFSKTPIFNSYHDLLTGRAYRYNCEMKERFRLINESKTYKIILPPLKTFPFTIYNKGIMGLTNNKNDWKNDEFNKYYKKEIIVKSTDSIFIE